MKSSTPAHQETGLLSACFWGAIKFMMWTVLGWCLALIISVGLLALKGIPAGLHYLQTLWIHQAQLLNAIAQQSGWLQSFAQETLIIINKSVSHLINNPFILHWMQANPTIAIKNSYLQHFV